MIRSVEIHVINSHENLCSLPLAIGLLISASVLVALCARHSKQFFGKKYAPTNTTTTSDHPKIAPPSPLLLRPKKIIEKFDNTADHPDHPAGRYNLQESESREIFANPSNDGFDEEGGRLWQKKILMGEKCQPPEFSGVLFYDSHGNRISELPRSPRSAIHNVGNYSS